MREFSIQHTYTTYNIGIQHIYVCGFAMSSSPARLVHSSRVWLATGAIGISMPGPRHGKVHVMYDFENDPQASMGPQMLRHTPRAPFRWRCQWAKKHVTHNTTGRCAFRSLCKVSCQSSEFVAPKSAGLSPSVLTLRVHGGVLGIITPRNVAMNAPCRYACINRSATLQSVFC